MPSNTPLLRRERLSSHPPHSPSSPSLHLRADADYADELLVAKVRIACAARTMGVNSEKPSAELADRARVMLPASRSLLRLMNESPRKVEKDAKDGGSSAIGDSILFLRAPAMPEANGRWEEQHQRKMTKRQQMNSARRGLMIFRVAAAGHRWVLLERLLAFANILQPVSVLRVRATGLLMWMML